MSELEEAQHELDMALREAFKAGMVAKDAGAEFDESDDWFDTYIEDEARREA